MKDITKIHNEAMELVERAFLAKQAADNNLWSKLTREAFIKEKEAVELLSRKFECEPTRSVLYQSAASLALDCGEIREAEKLISAALSGNPQEEIANELRDLLEKVHFERHLSLRGTKLLSNELQFSLSGKSIGLGLAPSEEFRRRVYDVETILYRTAERKRNKPYRDSGRRTKELEKELGLYISIPRAASFAVSFRIGTLIEIDGKVGIQSEIEGIGFGEEVIDEMLDCIDLVNNEKFDSLEQRIKDRYYYDNFIGLAKQIAPDGKDISCVGFTTFRKGSEKRVLLSTPKSKIAQIAKEKSASVEVIEMPKISEEIKVQGSLRLADSRNPDGLIDIIDENRVEYKIQVPKGMMADIVRPLYECEVIVTGRKKGDLIILEDIEKVSD